jgi:acyl dehydratase
MDEDRPLEPGLRLELGEQAVDVVDVPRALDLRDHHDLEPLADLGDDLGQVVQHPRALERVDTRPQRRLAELHLAADPDEPLAGGLLALHRDRVLEVAEQDVHVGRDLRRLGDHLLVREVEEMDHPRGLDGDLAEGRRGVYREGLEEVAGVSHARRNLPTTRIARPMTDTQTQGIETSQAAREASGARQYGRYLEEFEVGAVYKHWPAKTVTEADDHLFCLLTMNHHPLHINDVYAAESQQGRNVVVGPLVYSLALGMSVGDVSGKAIANLATEELSHPAPVFHGDTLFCESEVLDVRPSESKPDRGVVKVHTRVYKQDGTLVAEFKRAVLVPRRP